MTAQSFGDRAWFEPLIVAAFARSIPGLDAFLNGAPRSEWIHSITLAGLWGVLGVIWILDNLSGRENGEGPDFTGYDWARVATFLTISVVGIAFVSRGRDPIEVLDFVVAPLLLGLWLYLKFRGDEEQPGGETLSHS